MNAAAIFLAAAVWTASPAVMLAGTLGTGSPAVMLAVAPAAGLPPNLPMYPGGKATRVAGSLVITSADPLGKVKTGYTAVFRKAGWKPSVPDTVLNGDVPGASKGDMAALSRAITYLSFERRGETVDLFLAPGRDRHSKPITVITILGAGTETAPQSAPKTVSNKGDRHGRP